MPNVNIRVLWDDDSANIKKDYSTNDFKVKVTSELYNKMDPLFKLDFMSDMEEWVQQEVNRIHKDELNQNERFVYSYVMNTPKSSDQLQEEEDNPGILAARKEKAKELQINAQNNIGRIVKGKNGRSN
jgi:hypothetical protein|tara:strand:- start:16 stop:399 length:384 start_codon:yes stop_codon:yes gene_type:complete